MSSIKSNVPLSTASSSPLGAADPLARSAPAAPAPSSVFWKMDLRGPAPRADRPS